MKFLKDSFVLLLLLTLLSNVSNAAILPKSALKVANEFVKAGMNGEFKKLAKLCCKPRGPYTTYEDVRNLNLGELGLVEKLVREENSEIDPDNLKFVVARTRISGKVAFRCFFIFKTPANYKIYLRGDTYLFPYPPPNKEYPLAIMLEFYLLNYNKFGNKFIQKRFEEVLKDMNEDKRKTLISIFSYSYPEETMNLISSGLLKGEAIKFFFDEEKHKSAMKDIATISEAIYFFVSDTRYAPKQDGIYDKNSEFYKALSPHRAKELPVKDPWGNNYRVFTGTACIGPYGITWGEPKDFIVVSYGPDGQKENWKYKSTNPEAGLTIMKIVDYFVIDLVMWNTVWMRCIRR